VEKAGMQLLDSPDFPPDWIGIAIAHRDALDLLKASRRDWTSVCPAAVIHPGERTGKFRLGKDQLVVDGKGKSEISAEDFPSPSQTRWKRRSTCDAGDQGRCPSVHSRAKARRTRVGSLAMTVR
jgi:hypothetical protein